MNRMTAILSAVLLIVFATLPAGAQGPFSEWAVGFKSGTLGLGGELTTSLAPQWNLRGSVQWMELDFDAEIDDIDYDLDLDFLNPLVTLDWYPWDTGFRVSAGVLFNESDIRLDGTSDDPIEIGDSVYVPADYGRLRGESDFDDVAPYFGIGFGNPLTHDGRFGFTADLGVAYVGSPNVDLTATNPLIDATLRADLEREEEEIEDELDKWRFYPVLAFSLYYRF